MRLAIGLLVIGMGVTPLLLAIDHDLRVYRIGIDLAAMILGAPLAPACRLAADALVRAELRGFECLVAEAATTARTRQGRESSETGLRIDLLRKPDCRTDLQACWNQSQDIETAIESLTASSPMDTTAPAAPPPGAIGTAIFRRKWRRFSPPLTLKEFFADIVSRGMKRLAAKGRASRD